MTSRILNKYNLFLAAIVILMAFLLFQGLNQIYHQDEYRWIEEAFDRTNLSPHPPMTLFLLETTGELLGYSHLRVLPALFAILNILLVYLISKKLSANKSIALLAAFIFAINAYSLIAGLQIDADGAIIPFFVLASYYAYLRLGDNKRIWLPVLALCLICGFLTKLTFTLFVAALAIDFYLDNKNKSYFNLRKILWAGISLATIFAFVSTIFYFVSPAHFWVVADNFSRLNFNFGSRAYLDLGFKILKSIFLLSPLLLMSLFYALFDKELRSRYKLLFWYLFFNFIFYAVIFDFTTLTIERYFMFMIASSGIIGAEVIYKLFKNSKVTRKSWVPVALLFIIFAYLILSMGHITLPLNPKTAYITELRSLNFNFLIPFTGGSGPIGFYLSASFIFWTWFLSLASILGYYFIPSYKKIWVSIFIVVGLGYSLIFTSEFLFGGLFGSVPAIARETVDYVNNNPDIKQVITYYDIAPYDLRESGKYYSRFYTAPNRDYTQKITNFRGYYMIVNFPEIGESNQYWKLITRCPIQKEFQDKKIKSYIFNCTKLK